MTRSTDQALREGHREFIVQKLHPFVWKLGLQHARQYAEIMERICAKRHKPPSRALKKHLADNGVDVNDVWIVAVAMEHNLTLLTTDKMEAIREAVGPDVEFGNWCG